MNAIKALLMIVCLTAGAYFIGNIRRKKQDTLSEVLVWGVFRILAGFSIIYLPLVLARTSFTLLTILYGVVFVAAVIYSVIRNHGQVPRDIGIVIKELRKRWNFWYLMAVILICFQLYMTVTYMHIDDDDAFYVGTAVTTLETDTMYQYEAETGLPLKELPSRYVLSPLPFFNAFLSKVFLLPPAVTAHLVLAVFWILISYLIYMMLGKLFLQRDYQKEGMYLFFVAVLQMLGNFSVYSASTFTLSRTWQGKGMLTGILIPAMIYLCLSGWKENRKYQWDLEKTIELGITAGMVSSMGIMLFPIMAGIFGIAAAILSKSCKVLIKGIVCCIPSILLVALYVLLKAGGV